MKGITCFEFGITPKFVMHATGPLQFIMSRFASPGREIYTLFFCGQVSNNKCATFGSTLKNKALFQKLFILTCVRNFHSKFKLNVIFLFRISILFVSHGTQTAVSWVKGLCSAHQSTLTSSLRGRCRRYCTFTHVYFS